MNVEPQTAAALAAAAQQKAATGKPLTPAEQAALAETDPPPRPVGVTGRQWRWMPGDPGPDDWRSHP